MVNSGERVMGVACTDDKLIVDLGDGRTISVPLVWYPRLLHSCPANAITKRQLEVAVASTGEPYPGLPLTRASASAHYQQKKVITKVVTAIKTR